MIPKQHRRLAIICDQHIKVAVIIKIACGHSACGKILAENWTCLATNVFEAHTDVTKEKHLLAVLHARIPHLDEIIGMSVCQKQIKIAVIIIIEEPQAPSAEKLGGWRDLPRLVGECQILLIMIEAEKLLLDIGHKEILPPVIVIICCINSHT